jgi:hypothetical protein
MSRRPSPVERELLFVLPIAAGCLAIVLWLVA